MFVLMQAGFFKFGFRSLERIHAFIGNEPHRDPRVRAGLRALERGLDQRALAFCHGVKFTVGAFCAPDCASKYCFSANFEPNIPAIITVGNVSRLVLKARATSL